MTGLLDERTLIHLAHGCAVLGTGGGGDSEIGLLMAMQALADYGPAQLVDLNELPDDALIMPCGMIGAPTVSLEKIENGGEAARLVAEVEQLWGKPVVALMSAEIGGSNGLLPAAWAARLGLPVVDADGMGRAFPEVPMVTMELAGISPCPSVMTDERANVIVFRANSGAWLERLARIATVEFGGAAASAEYVLTAAEARSAVVVGSVSLAIKIGSAVAAAVEQPVKALVETLSVSQLITGKVADVERRTARGFTRGAVIVEGLGLDSGRVVRIEIQNENLVALERGHVLASVPDLITVLDSDTADAIATERVRYGQRVTVIAFPCAPVWRTPAGLALTGPRAFGYDFEYTSVEDLASARA